MLCINGLSCFRLGSLPDTGTTFLFRVTDEKESPQKGLFDITDITNGRRMLGLSVSVSMYP